MKIDRNRILASVRASTRLATSVLALAGPALASAGPARASAGPARASVRPQLAFAGPARASARPELVLGVPGRLAAAAAATPLAGASLESAATKAGETGRKVAMSMIALAFSIASIVLAFRRDFKEAAGVFAIGIVAILLATPAGVNVLHDTVNTLFGG